jgi:hypothetical protein
MMHRESGSYFHFLRRGWLTSYYSGSSHFDV